MHNMGSEVSVDLCIRRYARCKLGGGDPPCSRWVLTTTFDGTRWNSLKSNIRNLPFDATSCVNFNQLCELSNHILICGCWSRFCRDSGEMITPAPDI